MGVGPILVTGVGGTVGGVAGMVLDPVRAHGVPVRALVHHDDGRTSTLRAPPAGQKIIVNASPEPGPCCAALGMPFAVLLGQISAAHQAWPDASETLRFAGPASGRCRRRGRLGGG
ncbi:hypothetical protein ACH4ND_33230 [Streptomyces sp. NPDC017179]|uniref:hypothetical protein n=1 Tax=Streptomyces sp. NPDC017179 TaxID=3364979 RepID=UPI0037A22EFD